MILRKLVVWWLVLLVPVAVFAASGDEFYQRLYQRGMAHFAAGEYSTAFTELRNAGFGFVEQVDQFVTIQAYAAIAAHRLGHDDDARDSMLRIVKAEKIEPHYRSVKLPDDLRAEDDNIAAVLLTRQECTVLGVPTAIQDAARKVNPPNLVPTPSKTPNVAVTAPRDRGGADTASPESDPTTRPEQGAQSSQPPTLQPTTPATQPVSPVPEPADPQPQPAPPVSTAQPDMKNVDASFAEAQRAVDNGEIRQAQTIYDALLNGPQLPHSTMLRLGEGLYRVHDFAGATMAFKGAGTFGRGEELYHYYYAVALNETGRSDEAKRELAASLPGVQ
ncbi:MAG TPA: hypothetical protein VLC46_04310 [Thermoanaerobaculia bacterium]|nr:hypothetical protein [Thermoanaerobaculia bacterium]